MSTLKVDTINTTDGTGNITVARPLSGSGASLTNLPAANLTGTLPAISGANLTGLPASGDLTNHIIDGDFIVWPEGDKTAVVSGSYGPALWGIVESGGGSFDTTIKTYAAATTNVPTQAQSGHQSGQSFELGVNGTDSVSGDEKYAINYYFTGHNWSKLHRKEVTFNFWVKSTTTGTYCATLLNKNATRSYIKDFTIASANTWEEVTLTYPGDTVDTLYDFDTDGAARLYIVLDGAAGGAEEGSANTQNSSHLTYSTNLDSGFMSNGSNSMTFSQMGLYIGDTAPNFSSPSFMTVLDQVSCSSSAHLISVKFILMPRIEKKPTSIRCVSKCCCRMTLRESCPCLY